MISLAQFFTAVVGGLFSLTFLGLALIGLGILLDPTKWAELQTSPTELVVGMSMSMFVGGVIFFATLAIMDALQ